MHGPTTLYGSTSGASDADIVALHNNTIDNVYPLMYYGASGTVGDSDLVPPVSIDDGEVGAFVATSIEVAAGDDGTGVIVVSGASPYGDYQPMTTNEYYTVPLEGMTFVTQVFEFGMDYAQFPYPPTPTPTPFTIDPMLLIAVAGVVVVVIILVIVLKRR